MVKTGLSKALSAPKLVPKGIPAEGYPGREIILYRGHLDGTISNSFDGRNHGLVHNPLPERCYLVL